jgi:hypothetical protein
VSRCIPADDGKQQHADAHQAQREHQQWSAGAAGERQLRGGLELPADGALG